MKPLVLLLLIGFVSISRPAASRAAGLPARTNINPALLYWQAFTSLPSDRDHDYVTTNDWRGRKLDARFNELMPRYDVVFQYLAAAARQTAPCDWGHDLSEGPELQLPGLARAKAIAVATRLRLRWHLENGRPAAARDEFGWAMILSRRVSQDGILISALVRIAMENILVSALQESWRLIPPETLDQILAAVAAAPPPGTIARTVPSERALRDWFIARIEEHQKSSTNEAQALARAREILVLLYPDRAGLPDLAVASGGGTTDGLIRLLQALDAHYARAAELLALPYAEGATRLKAFDAAVGSDSNVLAGAIVPALCNSRLKEWGGDARWAMVRAAAEIRRSGEAGLARVPDPLTGENFLFRRAIIEGVDRGFELRSRAALREWPEALIFLERDGPPFQLGGARVGELIRR